MQYWKSLNPAQVSKVAVLEIWKISYLKSLFGIIHYLFIMYKENELLVKTKVQLHKMFRVLVFYFQTGTPSSEEYLNLFLFF